MRVKLNVVSCSDSSLLDTLIKEGLNKIVFPIDLDRIRTVFDLKQKIAAFYSNKLSALESKGEYRLHISHLAIEGFNLLDEFEIKDLLNTDDELRLNFENAIPNKKVIRMIDLVDEVKTKPKIKFQSQKVTTFAESSDTSSDDQESISSKSSYKNNKNNLLKHKTIRKEPSKEKAEVKCSISKPQVSVQRNKVVKSQKKVEYKDQNEDQDHSEDELLPVKQYKHRDDNNIYIRNKNPNYAKPETRVISKPNKSTFNPIEDIVDDVSLRNYIQIPSGKLEDLGYLKENYPQLFTKGSEVMFRIYEMTSNGPGVSKYKFGKIEEFSETSNSFLISLIQGNDDSLNMMYNIDIDLICVALRDFVELRIKSDSINTKTVALTPEESQPQANQIQTATSTTSGRSIVIPFIRKQIEFYFSDKNYYQDSFLLEKAKQDEDNYINLDVIMGFNKIRIMTNNKDLVREALKCSEVVEFDSSGNKIRKKNQGD